MFLSKAGLENLKKEEGIIDGLYDDPMGFCTFGVGHLVDQNHKWECFLLKVALGNEIWSRNVSRMWPGTRAERPYLTRGTALMDKFDELKVSAVEDAKPIIAGRKYNKDIKNLSLAERKAVDETAKSAVDAQGSILARTPDDVLREDLVVFETAVRSAVTETLAQDEFDALVSLCFNIGPGAFKRSSLVKEINKGKYRAAGEKNRKASIEAIENEFAAWNKSKLKGVAKRRQREADLFLGQARKELAELEKKTSPEPKKVLSPGTLP